MSPAGNRARLLSRLGPTAAAMTFGSGRASLPADVGLCPHCLRMYRAKHTPIARGAHGHPRSRLSRMGLGWRAGAGGVPRSPSPYTPLPACTAQRWMPHRAHPLRTVRIAVVSVALLLALPAPRTNMLRTSRHTTAPPPCHSAMLCGMKGNGLPSPIRASLRRLVDKHTLEWA